MSQADNLAALGSNVNSSGVLQPASGGTGATTTAGAANAILPSQTGNTGKYLTTDGTNTSWGTVTSNPGTVTSVGGTGTVNGITLTGTVTSSGNLTLGGTLSGVSLTTQVTGTLPVANGGTGTSSPSLVAGSGISISGSFPNQTITNTSSASGTVTSVATGNGLSGGTITTSGTLSVACPTFNTVGSYAFCLTEGGSVSSGSNYSPTKSWTMYNAGEGLDADNSTNLSGTWKVMGASSSARSVYFWLGCRVS
jgi:hypothetical protein